MDTFVTDSKQQFQTNARSFMVVGVIIALCCLAGILGRPHSFLAILWPANAVLLGLFLRFNALKNMGGWLGAFTGFMFADLVTGNHFLLTLFLTMANLTNPLVTLLLLRTFKIDYKEFNKGLTFVYLVLISAVGGCLVSPLFAISTIPHIPNTFMQMDRIWIDFGMWWTGEILNLVAFLPIILAIPQMDSIKDYIAEKRQQRLRLQDGLPLLFVMFSVGLTHFFMGPGAIMFPIGALIWAALTYNLFLVSIVNCFVSMSLYNILSIYYLTESSDAYISTTLSVRIGLVMLALGPLTLSIISLNRQKLYHHILYLANHDGLTTTMNRRYFYEESERTINPVKANTKTVAILLLDIDHFKRINDNYGHAVGDQVLQDFTRIVQAQIRASDLFGRIGGEEFAVLLKNVSLAKSIEIAERICNTVFKTPITLENGQKLNISISIGLSYQSLPFCTQFQQLINRADVALYQAKESGRNRLCLEEGLQNT